MMNLCFLDSFQGCVISQSICLYCQAVSEITLRDYNHHSIVEWSELGACFVHSQKHEDLENEAN